MKRDLALFTSQVERYRRGEWQLEQWNRFIQPFLGNAMSPIDAFPPRFRSDWGMPDPRVPMDWDAVLASREFEGILANRVMAAGDNIANLNRVLVTTERIKAQLDQLLASAS